MNKRNISKNLGSLLVALATVLPLGCAAKDSTNVDRTQIIAEYIANNEGRRNMVYDPIPNDGKYEPTIGVGYYLGGKDSREKFSRILPELDFDLVYKGKKKLSNEQIDRLFSVDLEQYIERTRKSIPAFDEYPPYLQSALVDGFYRGCLAGSPKTLRYINEGRFDQAANEYLNHQEYNLAKVSNKQGIRKRMEKNRDAILRYASEKRD